MTRRRPTRRERIERRERLREAEAAGIPTPQARAERDEMAPVSYSGAAGGLLGVGFMAALAIAILAGASEESRTWSLAFAGLALMFVPATIACLRPTPRRNRILRMTVVGCIVSALSGIVFVGPELPFVLALPTVLLAQAAGLILQGTPRR